MALADQRTTSLIDGPGLVHRHLRVQDDDIVFLRAVLEAYDGLASLFGDGRGRVVLTTTEGLAAELDQLLEALAREISIHPLAPTSD